VDPWWRKKVKTGRSLCQMLISYCPWRELIYSTVEGKNKPAGSTSVFGQRQKEPTEKQTDAEVAYPFIAL
jgi:hypothetical protein